LTWENGNDTTIVEIKDKDGNNTWSHHGDELSNYLYYLCSENTQYGFLNATGGEMQYGRATVSLSEDGKEILLSMSDEYCENEYCETRHNYNEFSFVFVCNEETSEFRFATALEKYIRNDGVCDNELYKQIIDKALEYCDIDIESYSGDRMDVYADANSNKIIGFNIESYSVIYKAGFEIWETSSENYSLDLNFNIDELLGS